MPNHVNEFLIKLIIFTIFIIVILLCIKHVYMYNDNFSEHVIMENTNLPTYGTVL